jgi:hypothetical protein
MTTPPPRHPATPRPACRTVPGGCRFIQALPGERRQAMPGDAGEPKKSIDRRPYAARLGGPTL